MQGPHQVAKKSSIKTLPRNSWKLAGAWFNASLISNSGALSPSPTWAGSVQATNKRLIPVRGVIFLISMMGGSIARPLAPTQHPIPPRYFPGAVFFVCCGSRFLGLREKSSKTEPSRRIARTRSAFGLKVSTCT